MTEQDIIKERPICIICGAAAHPIFVKDGYPHFECPRCHLVFVFPQPSGSFLAEEVYSEKSGYQSNKKLGFEGLVVTPKQQKIVDHLNERPDHTGQLFLDVGCSSGEIMYLAKNVGYKVTGVELNPRTASIARANGFEIHIGTLESAQYPDNSFDVVHMGDVIEHVPDPHAFLAETHRILRPGGELIIITPNMNCFWAKITYVFWKLFNVPWSMSTPPHHLYQFSDNNLSLLLQAAGFTVSGEWYTAGPTLKYDLGSLHLLKRWKRTHTLGNLFFMTFSYGLYATAFPINRLVELLPLKRFRMAMTAVKS